MRPGLGLLRFEVLVDTASLLLWLVLPQPALFDDVSCLQHPSDAAKLLVYDKHRRFCLPGGPVGSKKGKQFMKTSPSPDRPPRLPPSRSTGSLTTLTAKGGGGGEASKKKPQRKKRNNKKK